MYELQVIKQLFISYWIRYNTVIDILTKEVKVSLQAHSCKKQITLSFSSYYFVSYFYLKIKADKQRGIIFDK